MTRFKLLSAFAIILSLLPGVVHAAVPPTTTTSTSTQPYFDMVLDESRGLLYASDQGGGALRVIRTSDGTVISSIDLGATSQPAGLDMNSDGSKLAIALGGSGQIDIVALSSLTVAQTLLPLGTSGANIPYAVRFGAPGRLYSTGNPGSSGTDYLHVFDLGSGREIARSTAAVRLQPPLAYNPRSQSVYTTADYGFARFDVSTDAVPQPIAGAMNDGLGPFHTLGVTSDGNILTGDGRIETAMLDHIVGATGVQATRMAYSQANAHVYYSTPSGIISASLAFPFPLDGTIPLVAGAVAVNAAASRLYASTATGVQVVDLTQPLAAPPARPPSILPYGDLVLDEARGLVYGSDMGSGYVDVLSAATGVLVQSIDVGAYSRPWRMDISPDGNRLAVALVSGGQVALIDLAARSVVGHLYPAHTPAPAWVGYGRAGRLYTNGLYCIHREDGLMHVFDTTTNSEVGSGDAVCSPHVVMSPDRRFAYASSEGSVAVMDMTSDTPRFTRSTPGQTAVATDLAVSADGQRVFFSGQVWNAALTHQIGAFSVASGDVFTTFSGRDHRLYASSADLIAAFDGSGFPFPALVGGAGGHVAGPLRVNGAATRLYESTGSGLLIKNLPGGVAVPLPRPPSTQPYAGLILDNQRGVLYGSDLGAGYVRVISPADGAVLDSIDVGSASGPAGMDLSPDGSQLAVALSGAGQVVLVDLASRRITQHMYPTATSGPEKPFDLKYGRPGRIYTVGNGGQIDGVHVMDLTSGAQLAMTSDALSLHPILAMSPDRRTLYAMDAGGQPSKLYRFNVTTDSLPIPTQTPGNTGSGNNVAVSPDGYRVYTSNGQVWAGDLTKSRGTFPVEGISIALAPATDRVFVGDFTAIHEFGASYPYAKVGDRTMPSRPGPIATSTDGNTLYVSTASGVYPVDLLSPAGPTAIRAVAAVGSATVTWTPPTDHGNSAITSYTIRSSGGASVTVPGGQTHGLIAGLTTGDHTFTVSATNQHGTGYPSGPSNTVQPLPGGTFRAMNPVRIMDTTTGLGGVPVHQVGPGGSLTLQVTGRAGVPASGVSAVMMNVTATNPSAASDLTVYPGGTPAPLAWSLNVPAGQTASNLVEVAVGAAGTVTLTNRAGNTDIAADLVGWVGDATNSYTRYGLYDSVGPARILDTAAGTGAPRAPLGDGQTLNLQVTGNGGIPSTGVNAVVLELSASGATQASRLTAYQAGSTRPDPLYNLAFGPGQSTGARVVVRVGTGGQVSIFNQHGSVDVAVDVTGWYTDGSSAAGGAAFVATLPTRIFDTRTSTLGAVGPNTVLNLSTGPGPTSLLVNMAVTDATAASLLTVYPDDGGHGSGAVPGTRDMLFAAGETRSNLTIASLGWDHAFNTYNLAGSVDIVYDEYGYFGPVGPVPSPGASAGGSVTAEGGGAMARVASASPPAGVSLRRR